MAIATYSQVIENASEQILSSDLNRMQALASRDAQNVLHDADMRDEFTTQAGSPMFPPADQPVIPAADARGTIVGSISSFQVTLSPGQAYMYDSSITSPDASGYCVVRWPPTTITTIVPDGSTFRVDLIYATPAMVATDSQSRNLLVDPVARTVTSATVNKTNNPQATIAVMPGTPGTPSAPACPAGSIALWEVVTYQTNTHASDYIFIPRIWRRAEVLGSCHAILEGCVPQWGLDIESSASSAPYLANPGVHRAVIDGEVVVAALSSGLPGVIAVEPDTNANPLTATIDNNKDVMIYLYLCGGRYAPQNGLPVTVSVYTTYAPLRLVASLTAPAYNRANAALAINGVSIPAVGTLYVGLAAVSCRTHNYKPCIINGDWVYAQTASSGGAQLPMAGFNGPSVSGGSGAVDIYPAFTSTMCDLAVWGNDAGAPTGVTLYPGPTYSAVDLALAKFYIPTATEAAINKYRVPVPTGGHFNWKDAGAGTALRIFATGYNMNVPRLK